MNSSTPILDRVEPLPPLRGARRWQIGWAPIVFGVGIGVLFSFVDVRPWLAPVTNAFRAFLDVANDAGVLQFGAAAVASLFVSVAVHETGHAVAGWLAGFTIHSVRIWRLQLELPERRASASAPGALEVSPLKLSIYRGPSGGAGGWVICAPESTENLAARAGVMLAAGPAANLVTGFAVYALASATAILPLTFVTWSLLLGVVNLLPIRTGPLFSDGYRIVMLLFDRPRAERWLALLELSSEVLDGVPPESFSDEFIRIATAVKDDSSDTVSAHVMAYAAAFRRRRFDEAASALETCLRWSSRTSKAYQHALMADAAVFQGRARRNEALARAWLADMPAKPEIPWHRDWAEAGVLHAQGDRRALEAKLDAIEAAIRNFPGPQQQFLLGAVAFWRSELESVGQPG